jgi:dynein heavy chain
LNVVYMLLERKTDLGKVEWKNMQGLMSVGFFEKLKGFKKDEVQERIVKAIDKYRNDNEDFTEDKVKSANSACFSLCKWAFAINNYAKVAKMVEPKRKEVEAS